MGVFFYYLPGISPPHVNSKLLESRGLADALSDCLRSDADFSRIVPNKIARFSDGSDGTLLFADPGDGSVQRAGYYPDEQTWIEVDSGYWLGFNREHPPTPEHLRRPTVHGGYEHTLGDGNVWICPTISTARYIPRLPQWYGWQDGEVTSEVLPEHTDLWEKSFVWCDDQLTKIEQLEACRLCLSLNYRVGRTELTALKLLTTKSIEAIMESAVDIPWLEDVHTNAEKKSLLHDLGLTIASTSPGGEVSIPATDLPERTSNSLPSGTATEVEEALASP